jgi:hypothetical protein
LEIIWRETPLPRSQAIDLIHFSNSYLENIRSQSLTKESMADLACLIFYEQHLPRYIDNRQTASAGLQAIQALNRLEEFLSKLYQFVYDLDQPLSREALYSIDKRQTLLSNNIYSTIESEVVRDQILAGNGNTGKLSSVSTTALARNSRELILIACIKKGHKNLDHEKIEDLHNHYIYPQSAKESKYAFECFHSSAKKFTQIIRELNAVFTQTQFQQAFISQRRTKPIAEKVVVDFWKLNLALLLKSYSTEPSFSALN